MVDTEAALTRIESGIARLESRLDDMREEDEATGIMLHFITEQVKPGGIVVDEELARATACRCFEYQGKDYCFSKGVIGMLTQEEEERFCPTRNYAANGRKERYQKFAAAAEKAHRKIEEIPPGERLIPWLETMSQELRKEGIEV